MNGLRMLSWTCLRAGWPESCYCIYFLKIVVGVAVRPSPLISCYVTRAILDSALSESQKGHRRGPRGFPMGLVVFCLLRVSSLSGDIDQRCLQ